MIELFINGFYGTPFLLKNVLLNKLFDLSQSCEILIWLKQHTTLYSPPIWFMLLTKTTLRFIGETFAY